MKAEFVNENINEDYEDSRSEFIDRDMIDDNEMFIQDDFETSINNELEVPEFSRRSFKVLGSGGMVDAIPMAKLKDGSFLMKIGNKYQKFNVDDIIDDEDEINY